MGEPSVPTRRGFKPDGWSTRRSLAFDGPIILRLGYDIQFDIPSPVAMVALLNVHPSRVADLRAPDEVNVEPAARMESYIESFGNRCARFVAPAGTPA